jgi:hypothetical protein
MTLIYLIFKIISNGIKNPRILRDIWLGLFTNGIFSAIHDGFKPDVIILIFASILGIMLAENKQKGDL